MCQCRFLVFSAVLACSVFLVTPFNIDFVNYASYEGTFNSMFGFSIAVHKERNNGWLIVGAPEAQSSYQAGVTRGGAVFKCPTDRDGDCTEIPFDTRGDNYSKDQQMDNKTEQWFGATVSSAGREEGPIVACAPRYTWYPRNRTRRDPVGTCYVSNGLFNQFNEYSPCRTYQWGYHRQGSCQAGFSAAINSVGDRLFIGSPGSWYWQGQMYSIDAHATFKFKPDFFAATYGEQGQVHQQSLETRPAVVSTTEGTEKDDDSYMGYSTIVGDFQGNGEEGIAVGMPRGNDLRGKVLLFSWNLTNFLHHFTSDQIGSYYGYALAASDVDGDGKLDLIVGAPMYTVQDNKDKYDVGRVYVIYHESEKGRFSKSLAIDGFNSKSRFGQALASLGDINQDGYGDFAVGAPYDGENNGGAVYIYLGSNKGVRKKYSQVIFAEEVIPVTAGFLTTFGFSITGGLDLDDNEYPDMAVGAYLSNKAFFFRSRPVIRVEASVTFLTRGKEVDITKPNYTLRTLNGTQAVTTQIQFCSRYYGKGIPDSLDLGLEYILDAKKLIDPRMGFVDDEGQNRKKATITLYKDVNIKCLEPINVYVRTDARDKLTALVAEVTYHMKDEGYIEQLRNPRSLLSPVLDLHSPPSKRDSISIHKNCGDDNVCIPNLVPTVTPNVQEYLLDSGEKLFLEIEVANTGEDAFESTVEVKYPDSLYFTGIKDIKSVSRVLCSSVQNDTVIKCEIGNPIPQDKVVIFQMLWEPNYNKITPTYKFVVSVNSTNPERPETRHDNIRSVEVGILSDFHQEIIGQSHPTEVFFSSGSSLYTADISNQTRGTPTNLRLSEEVIGPQVTHVYHLKNEGKTTIRGTELFFVWPATTLSGEDFFYLLEPPQFSMTENLNIRCGPIPANYRNFELLSTRKTIWERLHLDVQNENETATASKRVEAAVSGKNVSSDSKTDKQVENSGDSSGVISGRKNKTQETTSESSWIRETRTAIQAFQGGDEVADRLGWGKYRYRQIDGKDYVYRCYRDAKEVDCGQSLAFLGTEINALLLKMRGRKDGMCLKSGNDGKWIETACGRIETPKTIPGVYGETNEVTVQVFQGDSVTATHLQSANLRRQRIDGQDIYYRCFRKVNGKEEQTDCQNISLIDTNVGALLQEIGMHRDGNLRYQCLERDNTGSLRRGSCNRLPKIEVSTTGWQYNRTSTEDNMQKLRDVTIQLFQGDESASGKYRRYRINGQDYYYRCFRRVSGKQEEIDCGQDFSFSGTNIAVLLQQLGLEREGNVRYQCFQSDNNGNLKRGDCWNIPKISTPRSRDITVQLFQGDEAAGSKYRRQRINGQEFYYRCFKRLNGVQKEVDCGGHFSFAGTNINALLQQLGFHQEGNIRYQCLESDSSGEWRRADCWKLPKLPVIHSEEVTIQLFQGDQAATSNYHRQRINGQDYYYRCFKKVDGVQEEVDCGQNISFSTSNIAALLNQLGFQQEGRLKYQCLETDSSGNLKRGDCWNLPKLPIGTTTWEYNQTWSKNISSQGGLGGLEDISIQLFQGDADVSSSNYRQQQINGQDYYYRCFKKVDGREEEVDCGDNLPLKGSLVSRLLQQLGMRQEGNVRYQCLQSDRNGNLKPGECWRLPKIPMKAATTVNRFQYNETHFRNASGIFRIDSSRGFLGIDVYTIQVFLGGQNVANQLGSGSYRYEQVDGQEYVFRCFSRQEQEVDCGAGFTLTSADIVWLLQRISLQQEAGVRYGCFVQGENQKWRNVNCGRLPTLQKVTSGRVTSTNVDIIRRCHKLVDNAWQLVDCNSDPMFQNGTATGSNFVQECYKTENGVRDRIPCDQAIQYQKVLQAGQSTQQTHGRNEEYSYNQQSRGSSQSSGHYDQHGANTQQQGGQYQGGNYEYDSQYEYDEDDEEEDTSTHNEPSSREPPPTHRNPSTYGKPNTQNVNLGVGGAAQNKGFTTAFLDLGIGTSNPSAGTHRQSVETHWSETREVDSPYNNLDRDNVPTDNPRSTGRWRGKRQVLDDHPSIAEVQSKYPCKTVGCIYMRCTIENLEHEKPLYIALRGRVNARVLRNMGLAESLSFSSMMLARVNKLPHIGAAGPQKLESHELTTTVKKREAELKADIVPLWVVVLSAVAGTIILLLVVFLLYKCGFFKRNRPSSAPERQPLNRNGYHHGDEAL